MALVCALCVPAFVEVAAAHRSHWSGAGQGPYWSGFVLPWAATLYTLIGGAAACGAAALGAPRRAPAALAHGVLVTAFALLASVPGWVWLHRIGGAEAAEIAAAAFQAGGIVALGTLAAALLAGRLPSALAGLLGVAGVSALGLLV